MIHLVKQLKKTIAEVYESLHAANCEKGQLANECYAFVVIAKNALDDAMTCARLIDEKHERQSRASANNDES